VLLKPDRLRSFSDSVIVVAVVLLVYNLATIATTDPEAFQPQLFFGTLVAYVNSFIVVFFFWVTFTTLLDYIKQLDDIVVLLSLIYYILVRLTPVANVAFHQQKNVKSIVFKSLVEISAASLLIWILFYVAKSRVLSDPDARLMLFNLCVIPSVYAISLVVSFFNFSVAQMLPFSVIPLVIIIRVQFHKMQRGDDDQ
jgi:uncharacterized membrane protein